MQKQHEDWGYPRGWNALQKPPLREYLLNNNRGEATLALRSAVDDYAGFLTGNREALWAQDARSIQPKWD